MGKIISILCRFFIVLCAAAVLSHFLVPRKTKADTVTFALTNDLARMMLSRAAPVSPPPTPPGLPAIPLTTNTLVVHALPEGKSTTYPPFGTRYLHADRDVFEVHVHPNVAEKEVEVHYLSNQFSIFSSNRVEVELNGWLINIKSNGTNKPPTISKWRKEQ